MSRRDYAVDTMSELHDIKLKFFMQAKKNKSILAAMEEHHHRYLKAAS